MLFSALVDADFLATETYMNRAHAELRQSPRVSLKEIAEELTAHVDRLGAGRTGAVNDCRRAVLEACRRRAELSPGAFSLTVPTGGGKTLASLEFALRHAIVHGLERVIVAIPFTSIIEQTANVYREVLARFPREVVLEHHSNLDPRKETPLSRLNAENWDAPIVVTTNVQLLESLYAAKTSRCRKLHRLAKSVIVLDEAQTLPVQLLEPSLRALRELIETYGSSMVLCTATQPALNFREDFTIGIDGVREIVERPEELYRAMRRVRIERVGVLSDEELAGHLARQEQALCIVGSRPYAARLYRATFAATEGEAGVFHLSTFMCGQHRSDTLDLIRARLAQGLPCRVVSTQLIEAGVDADFPIVYRALAGLDSIAQAAGRCNREGKRAEGVVHVFDPPERPPAGFLRTAAEATSGLWDIVERDPLGLESVRKYFEELYWKKKDEWDAKRIMEAFDALADQNFDFATAEEKFRMIEETGTPVLIPYEAKGRNLIKRLRNSDRLRQPPSPLDRRLAQRYAVSVLDQAFDEMRSRGCVQPLHDEQYHVLVDEQLYDSRLGIQVDRIGVYEPGGLIV